MITMRSQGAGLGWSAVTEHRRNDEERGENCVHFTDEEEEVGKMT